MRVKVCTAERDVPVRPTFLLQLKHRFLPFAGDLPVSLGELPDRPGEPARPGEAPSPAAEQSTRSFIPSIWGIGMSPGIEIHE